MKNLLHDLIGLAFFTGLVLVLLSVGFILIKKIVKPSPRLTPSDVVLFGTAFQAASSTALSTACMVYIPAVVARCLYDWALGDVSYVTFIILGLGSYVLTGSGANLKEAREDQKEFKVVLAKYKEDHGV